MQKPSRPHHRYENLTNDQIRLLELQAGAADTPLECIIHIVSLATDPWYEALSYCWGTGPQSEQVNCGDDAFPITAELSAALKQIRSSKAKRVLWIDQICIDQNNDVEKTSQVNMMSTIYSQADCVLVWLGVDDDETDLAFDVIADIGQQIRKLMPVAPIDGASGGKDSEWVTSRLQFTSSTSPEWISFRKLLRRPWFTRAWTYQELVLSRKAMIICGRHFVSWKSFSAVYGAIWTHSRPLPAGQAYLIDDSGIMQSMIFGVNMVHTKRESGGRSIGYESHELCSLVRRLRPNGATDPRDKIYALLGVANDIDATTPKVDYAVHFRLVYCDFSKWFINVYQDLYVLKLVNILPEYGTSGKSSCLNLPSWVPDYRFRVFMNNMRVEMGPQYALHASQREYNATGLSKARMSDSDRLQLGLQGVHVGRIIKVSDPAGNLVGDVAIGSRVKTGGQWSNLVEQFFIDGTYPPTKEPIQLAYSRLRVADYLPDELNASQRRERKLARSLPEPGPITFSAQEDALVHHLKGDIGALIIKCTTRQRLYFTDSGYMGLCHRSCEEGDQVYLLMGGDMPFVLRKLDTGFFQFKGESYVHGIMDGEFLLKSFKNTKMMKDEEWLRSLETGPLPFRTETVILT